MINTPADLKHFFHCIAAQKLKQKPSAPTKDATSAPKPPPSKPCTSDDDLDCDLKKLFNKNTKRVPHVPDSSIPNMLEVLKQKEKLRKQKEKEEDEERIKREREVVRERGERERERQRDEKEKAHHRQSSDSSSKHKHKSHHSDQKTLVSSTSTDGKSNGNWRPGQFKIPKKPQISYDDILALAAKKQSEPESAAAPAAPVVKKPVTPTLKPESGRLMTQAEKDRWARINSEEYQNWLKNGGPPPKNLPQTSKGKNSSSVSKGKVSSTSQLDRRKSSREELVGSRSDKCKINDKSQKGQSPDQGRTMDRASTANGQLKTSDRSQSNGYVKQNGVRSSTSQLPSDRSNRVETTSSHLSESQRKSKSSDQGSGLRKDQKSSEMNRSTKPSVSQKDLPVKTVVNEKNVDVCKSNLNKRSHNEKNVDVSKSNPNINKRPPDSQRLKSNDNDTKPNNSGANSTAGVSGQKEQVMKDFYIQCKKLKESGFLSDSLIKSLENELREKLKSLRKGDSSNASKPNTSGNNSRPSSDKPSAKPSASHSHQSTSKVMPSNNKVKSSLGVSSSSSSLKRDEKSDSKSLSAWDRIRAENRQFKPKPNPGKNFSLINSLLVLVSKKFFLV